MVPTSPSKYGENPFILMFAKGNISRCAGCGNHDSRNTDGKPHAPPGDLCLQHKEHVTFESPRTGLKQLSHDLRNVYYHARRSCTLKSTPHPQVAMSGDVRKKLSAIHINYIMSEFGLQVLFHVDAIASLVECVITSPPISI